MEGLQDVVCGTVIFRLQEEPQREIEDARGEDVRFVSGPSACVDEVTLDEVPVQLSSGREFSRFHRINLIVRLEAFEMHNEHVREGVLVRCQVFAPRTEEEVIRREGIFEVTAFDVSEDDGVEEGEIGSNACVPHICDRRGEFAGVCAACETGYQVGERCGVDGCAIIDAVLEPRFGVLELPALNVDLD